MSNLVHSFTKIQLYTQCPKQYLHKYIYKDTPKPPPSVHLEHGKRVDTDIENALKGLPLPDDLAYLEPLLARFKATHYEVFPQRNIGLDGCLRPCDYFDNDQVKWRLKLDLVGLRKTGKNTHGASVIDWKTGKIRQDSGQLGLYGAGVFCEWPFVAEVSTAYFFVDHKKASKTNTYKLHHFKQLWGYYQEQADTVEEAYRVGDWPAKESGLCRFCECTPQQCSVRGKYK